MSDDLAEYLSDASVAAELVRWGRRRGWTPSVPARRWHSKGYTGATVALLNITGPAGARKAVVKIAPPVGEPGRHEPDASPYDVVAAQCPPAFRPHLVLESEPGWTTPARTRITLQELAGDDVYSCQPLDALPRVLLCEALRAVPAALLLDWNEGSFVPQRTTIAGAIGETLGGLLSARGSLHMWAERLDLLPEQAPWIEYGDGTIHPNPLLLAEADSSAGRRPIDLLAGRCHGDLHVGNVLVPEARAGRPDPGRFQLIDLDTYQPEQSLSTDPVYLLLSAVAVALPGLPAREWDAVAEAVLGRSGEGSLDLAHAAVGGAEEAVRAASPTLLGDWRWQRLVSTLGVALAFTTFSKLGRRRRAWFFWLAARAGRAMLEELGEAVPHTGVRVEALFGAPVAVAADVPGRHVAPGVDHALGRIWRLPRDAADADALFKEAYREAVAVGEPGLVVPLLRGVLADAERRLGPDARTTLALLHALGFWTYRAGNLREARQRFDEAWRRRSDALGPIDPDTLESKAAAGDPRLYRDGE